MVARLRPTDATLAEGRSGTLACNPAQELSCSRCNKQGLQTNSQTLSSGHQLDEPTRTDLSCIVACEDSFTVIISPNSGAGTLSCNPALGWWNLGQCGFLSSPAFAKI